MSITHELLPPGTVLAGKLRVVRQIGAGGMGAVYEIEHEITKHRRALKVLHADVRSRPGIVERFLREASAAGRIGNAHIVETFDAGSLEGGEPYVVLELLTGETLAERLQREGRLRLDDVTEIVAQACEGVGAAHTTGIVHRDLKPENIFLVARADGPPFVKILDFGISKFDADLTDGAALTGEGATLGTPLYMAPEQGRGQLDLDARADVYALGVILYECVAGEPPFMAASLAHLTLLIQQGKCAPLTTRRPDLPEAFCALVAKAMHVDRDRRYPSAAALREALLGLRVGGHAADMFAETAPESTQRAPSNRPSVRPSERPSVRPSPSVPPRPMTMAPASSPVPPASPSVPPRSEAPPRAGRGLLLAAVVAAAALGTAAAFFARSSPRAASEGRTRLAESAATASAPPSASALAPPATTQTAAPSIPNVEPAATASASAAPSALPPRAVASAVKPPAVTAPAATASSRAAKTGLAGNPFQ